MAATVKYTIRHLNADKLALMVIGTDHYSGSFIPQMPATVASVSGKDLPVSPRVLTLTGNATQINKLDLVHAPPFLKLQLGNLIDAGKIEILNESGAAIDGDTARGL